MAFPRARRSGASEAQDIERKRKFTARARETYRCVASGKIRQMPYFGSAVPNKFDRSPPVDRGAMSIRDLSSPGL